MSTPVLPGKQMSESLKERLKRCGRSYRSPVISKPSTNTEAKLSNVTLTVTTTPKSEPRTSSHLKSRLAFKSPATVPRPNQQFAQSTTVTSCEDNTRRTLAADFESELSKAGDIEATVKNTDNVMQVGKGVKRKRQACCLSYVGNKRDQTTETSDNLSTRTLLHQKQKLQALVAEKEETLRKLKMVKLYRAKNDLSDLEQLINKWRSVSQEALVRLQTLALEPKPTLTQLVDHLHLDYAMIGFSSEDETFS